MTSGCSRRNGDVGQSLRQAWRFSRINGVHFVAGVFVCSSDDGGSSTSCT
jgi:hypothetical protein